VFRGNWFEQFQFEVEVEQSAHRLWKLLVAKVGQSKAKRVMLGVMGDKKPGPQNKPERRLNELIQGCISRYARESDEKIAKRILARKLHYVRYESGGIGIMNGDELTRDDIISWEVDGDEYTVDCVRIAEWNSIGKSLISLKKRVQRIRRQMIEDGSLGKEYAPRRYYRG
jgi:hypothetical protein